MSKNSNKELFAEMVNEIVGLMEKNDLNWSAPFKKIFHQNPVSGSIYRGVNPFILSITAHRKGFKSPYWATFNQIAKSGAKVKKGENSTPVFFFTIMEKEDKETKEVTKIPVFKSYRVFNVEQIDGVLKTPKGVELIDFGKTPFSRENCDKFFENCGIKETIHPGQAAYSPVRDVVMMPAQEQFTDLYAYYATKGHEYVHATGHASRLDREGITDPSATFGSEMYAFEELIAELGAVFLCSHLGIDKGGVDENHAAYLKGWMKRLKEEPMALWKAAAKAQAAFDYLCEQQN